MDIPDADRCIGTIRSGPRRGEPCKRARYRGTTVCLSHGAAAPQVRAKADIRSELSRWAPGETTVDPGEILLRLITQSYARLEMYAVELDRVVGESETLKEALIGKIYGEFGEAGEYVKGLVVLEAQERDRCANFATKAIAAGLAKRQVEVAEMHAALMMKALDAALVTAGVAPEQRSIAKLEAIRVLQTV